MNKSDAGKMGAIASAEVLSELKRARIDAYYSSPKKCNTCCNVIPYEKRIGKFCSRSCAASFNNKNRPRRKSGEVMNCHICGKEMNSRNERNNKFCSVKCASLNKKNNIYEAFQLGNVTSKVAKMLLIEQHGFKCMECGWDKVNPITNRCTVELEHVDGNSQNNHPTNLKLLCPNCHSLTPTYKALNVGNGRFSRRKRYHEGKSS